MSYLLHAIVKMTETSLAIQLLKWYQTQKLAKTKKRNIKERKKKEKIA